MDNIFLKHVNSTNVEWLLEYGGSIGDCVNKAMLS